MYTELHLFEGKRRIGSLKKRREGIIENGMRWLGVSEKDVEERALWKLRTKVGRS